MFLVVTERLSSRWNLFSFLHNSTDHPFKFPSGFVTQQSLLTKKRGIMNLQPSTQNRLYQHSINIEVSNQQETAGSACDRLLSNFATVASAAGGILGIAAAALQIKNPDSAGGSVTENTAIAAVVGNIMALVGTGISRDSERDIQLSLRQSNAYLPLIFAAAVFVRGLTHLVALEKQHLCTTLTSINFCW